MEVVGGVYIERCVSPEWDALFGSAGRAASVIAQCGVDVRLTSYVAPSQEADLQNLASLYGFRLNNHRRDEAIAFEYQHPLAIPQIFPRQIQYSPNLSVKGQTVLQFGMMECAAVVAAKTAVYDPQSASDPRPFRENGSTAERLAIILNFHEARHMTGEMTPEEAALSLLKENSAELVIVKCGVSGVILVESSGQIKQIPAFKSQRVWKIGSGDVFSAAFTVFWAEQGLSAGESAMLASKATAFYCESRRLDIPGVNELKATNLQVGPTNKGTIYLAAPFFDTAQLWLVNEIRNCLTSLGAKVLSPLHDIGRGPANIVAPQDLQAIDDSNCMLAVLNGLDPGTVFEIGYAVGKGKSVVAFGEHLRSEDTKMILGTGQAVIDDLATAIYHAIWASGD